MTSIRLSTRTELKNNIGKLYDSINEGNQKKIKSYVDKIEDNITIYYNTRGLECTRFDKRFIEIRNLLNRYSGGRLYKKKLQGYILELNKELKYDKILSDNDGGKPQDPIKLLKYITDDLLDDYSSFNLTGGQDVIEKNHEALELIKDDLIEIRELEPLFRDKPDDLREKYNVLCKTVNLCLMIIPQVNDITISAKNATVFRQSFEGLFNMVTEIFVPVKPEVKIEELKANAEVTKEKLVDAEVKDKSLNQLGAEVGIDLEEMERKAKEGIFDNGDLSKK